MEKFIENAKKIHGNQYDYSEAEYKGYKTKIKIKCLIHGYFFQTPNSHISCKKGCSKCKKEKKLIKIKENFISKVSKIHNEKYDYTQIDYKNILTKIKIICPVHGEFLQTPKNHLKYGCNKCARKEIANKQRSNKTKFAEKAKLKHGEKYDYSKVVYTQAHSKVEIICPIHGSFHQAPNSHYGGKGCAKCSQGENHPKFGKPAVSSQGYFGCYKNTVFRSLSELSWMLEMEKNNIKFVGLDQPDTRKNWQVYIFYDKKPHTYCADFFIPSTNEIVDIKPEWKEKLDQEKLIQGKIEYEKLGYSFKIIHTEKISKKTKLFEKLVKEGEIKLYPSSIKRFEKRFGIIPNQQIYSISNFRISTESSESS